LAPKPIDIFSYLFKSHCCLDQSESKPIIYFWTQFNIWFNINYMELDMDKITAILTLFYFFIFHTLICKTHTLICKLRSNSLKFYRIVNNNGFSKLSTFRAAQKAPVAAVVIQSCHWNHVGKLFFHKISTILFVTVPLIIIYIQVSDSGYQEPLVNISVIMTYNLEQVILFCIICITPWYDRSVTMLRTEAC
jgi:hypothetical protein